MASAHVDEEADDEDLQWRQLVLQRVAEHLRHLDIFTSGGYDHLRILNLQQNQLSDISALSSVGSTLWLLNVAHNALKTLPDAAFWQQFVCLQMLNLGQNELTTWEQMQGLEAATSVQWLVLQSNPFMYRPKARRFVVNKLSFLIALDDSVISEVEWIQYARPNARFHPQSLRYSIDHLHMPLEWDDDYDALHFLHHTQRQLTVIYAHNSPSIVIQRHVRGFLSRRDKFPRLSRVRQLIATVQAHARGFLFRQRLWHQFEALVRAKGQGHLLLSPVENPTTFNEATRRALKKLLVLVREWKRKFHQKKQAIAIKKIRFWCIMIYQRYKQRAMRLLKSEQELFIYYPPTFGHQIIEFAVRSIQRDPFLMATMASTEERVAFLQERCGLRSGATVIRAPGLERTVDVTTATSRQKKSVPMTPDLDENEDEEAVRPSTKQLQTHKWLPPIVRLFPSDLRHENHILISEKHLLQRDLETLRAYRLELKTKKAMNDTAVKWTSAKTGGQRALELHIQQLEAELERRLVICNKKILSACIHLQTLKLRATDPQFKRRTLGRIAIWSRGFVPSPYERASFYQLMQHFDLHASEAYPRLHVFVPWSIDMYMQVMNAIQRYFRKYAVSAVSFALSCSQVHQIHAAVTIQCAWRRSSRRLGLRRQQREVAISRALRCLQRWWRYTIGLKRRLAILRASVLLGASINSNVLFMEASVYQSIADPVSWKALAQQQFIGLWSKAPAVAWLSRCREHALHCVMDQESHNVVIELSPTQLALQQLVQSMARADSESPNLSTSTFRLESIHPQHRAMFFPLWMPAAPSCREETMGSRDQDATPLLLTDQVVAEATLLERELMIGAQDRQRLAYAFYTTNPFRRYRLAHQVAQTSALVMDVAQRMQSTKTQPPWLHQDAQASLSLVRLTFASVDEARKRAMVLLWKTFDPRTQSYARLYSIETLVGAALLRHQWALGQVLTSDHERKQLVAQWQKHMQGATMPSVWASRMRLTAPPLVHPPSAQLFAAPLSLESASSHPAPLASPLKPVIPPISISIPRPTPLHVAVAYLSDQSQSQPASPDGPALPSGGICPHPPPQSASSSSSGNGNGRWNRHLMLTQQLDQLEVPDHEQIQRELRVRDLREERERAMEALVVDRRMIQRENAATVAGIKLEIDVQLQKLRYARALAQLEKKERIEQEKVAQKRLKLTKTFEKSFRIQTGAMMRLAAREAVADRRTEQLKDQQQRQETKRREHHEAHVRRQDAKSFHFVLNQQSKQLVQSDLDERSEVASDKNHIRLQRIRQRKTEDKEIKRMLKLI